MNYRPSELLDKITYEGGVPEAIAYGIKPDDVPDVVADEWDRALGLIQELQECSATILGRLHAIMDEEAEEWEDEWGIDNDDDVDDGLLWPED